MVAIAIALIAVAAASVAARTVGVPVTVAAQGFRRLTQKPQCLLMSSTVSGTEARSDWRDLVTATTTLVQVIMRSAVDILTERLLGPLVSMMLRVIGGCTIEDGVWDAETGQTEVRKRPGSHEVACLRVYMVRSNRYVQLDWMQQGLVNCPFRCVSSFKVLAGRDDALVHDTYAECVPCRIGGHTACHLGSQSLVRPLCADT